MVYIEKTPIIRTLYWRPVRRENPKIHPRRDPTITHIIIEEAIPPKYRRDLDLALRDTIVNPAKSEVVITSALTTIEGSRAMA